MSVFQAIAEAAATLPGAKLARVWVDDTEEGVLREKGRCGIDDAAIRDLCDRTEFRYSEGLVGKAFVSGLVQFVADVQREPLFRNPRLARAAGLHGFAGFPLTIGNRVLGVLSITFGGPQRFTPAQTRDDHAAWPAGRHRAAFDFRWVTQSLRPIGSRSVRPHPRAGLRRSAFGGRTTRTPYLTEVC